MSQRVGQKGDETTKAKLKRRTRVEEFRRNQIANGKAIDFLTHKINKKRKTDGVAGALKSAETLDDESEGARRGDDGQNLF